MNTNIKKYNPPSNTPKNLLFQLTDTLPGIRGAVANLTADVR